MAVQSFAFDEVLIDIRRSQQVCHCDIHDHELIRQLDARLPNGRPIRILQDSYGYHVAIGEQIHLKACPPPVSAEEVERMIQAELRLLPEWR